ncbi:unnamed protein product [Aphis gossypii]|uniref:Major facilitator superfamily (MFS) profile domain-containing protein n=1 Tax=Aphis gossypii TaxID=80765 RepID=A0A9P0J459_APHGO|nr:unnamed protein product [Aphis gossypii]
MAFPTTYTDEKTLPQRFPQFSYSILAGLSGVLIGTAFAWNSAATRLTRTFGNNDCTVNRDTDSGWYVDAAACYFLGTSIGGLILGPVMRMIGYRWSMIACDVIVLIGWLLLSQVYWAPVWVTRLAHGIGTGGLGLLTPTYIAHITDFRIRGRALVFHHAFVCFGVFYAHALSAIVTDAQLTGICMVWPVLHIIVASFLPESPLYAYICCDDAEKTKSAMRRINGVDYDVNTDYAELERYVFEYECLIGENKCRLVRKIIAIGMKLVVLQHTCGASAAIFHAKSVIGGFGLTTEVAGYSDERVYANTQTIITIVFATQVLLCLTTVELVEFLGRKFMLNASAIGMGLCLASIMLYQSFFPTTDICTSAIESDEWHKYVPIILVCIYLCSYSIGWGPIVALIYAEVVYFNKWYSSLIYASGQFVLFLVAYVFFDAKALLGFNKYVMWTYIASCVLSIISVYFCVPETRALPLNRILHRQLSANYCTITRNQ